MAIINYVSSEINCKIVYYGPGLSGKTTNLKYIHDRLEPQSRGKLISLDTATERTLFFDFLPVELGKIRGMITRLHIYTVPGQIYYNESRKLVLKGLDGLVFVADSQDSRREANIFSLTNLYENLNYHRISNKEIPFVFQYNKRDIMDVLPVQLLQRELNNFNLPYIEASAVTGKGVFDTFKTISKLAIQNIDKTLHRK